MRVGGQNQGHFPLFACILKIRTFHWWRGGFAIRTKSALQIERRGKIREQGKTGRGEKSIKTEDRVGVENQPFSGGGKNPERSVRRKRLGGGVGA